MIADVEHQGEAVVRNDDRTVEIRLLICAAIGVRSSREDMSLDTGIERNIPSVNIERNSVFSSRNLVIICRKICPVECLILGIRGVRMTPFIIPELTVGTCCPVEGTRNRGT